MDFNKRLEDMYTEIGERVNTIIYTNDGDMKRRMQDDFCKQYEFYPEAIPAIFNTYNDYKNKLEELRKHNEKMNGIGNNTIEYNELKEKKDVIMKYERYAKKRYKEIVGRNAVKKVLEKTTPNQIDDSFLKSLGESEYDYDISSIIEELKNKSVYQNNYFNSYYNINNNEGYNNQYNNYQENMNVLYNSYINYKNKKIQELMAKPDNIFKRAFKNIKEKFRKIFKKDQPLMLNEGNNNIINQEGQNTQQFDFFRALQPENNQNYQNHNNNLNNPYKSRTSNETPIRRRNQDDGMER